MTDIDLTEDVFEALGVGSIAVASGETLPALSGAHPYRTDLIAEAVDQDQFRRVNIECPFGTLSSEGFSTFRAGRNFVRPIRVKLVYFQASTRGPGRPSDRYVSLPSRRKVSSHATPLPGRPAATSSYCSSKGVFVVISSNSRPEWP